MIRKKLIEYLPIIIMTVIISVILTAIFQKKTKIYTPNLSNEEKLLNLYFANEELVPFNYGKTSIEEVEKYKAVNLKNQITPSQIENYLKNIALESNAEFCYLNYKDLYPTLFNFNRLQTIQWEFYLKLVPQQNIEDYISKPENKEQKYLFRKFEKCHSIFVVNDNIYLVVLGIGKRYPSIYLMIYNRNNLEFKNMKTLYQIKEETDTLGGSEYISHVYRIKSCLNSELTKLTIYQINQSFSSENIINKTDTIVTVHDLKGIN
jgi:hypothetical protein